MYVCMCSICTRVLSGKSSQTEEITWWQATRALGNLSNEPVMIKFQHIKSMRIYTCTH